MISLKSVEIQNFLSFGNYKTTIPLSDLKQCFIAGEIVNEDQLERSNGAGKSSLMQAILWCLTGRTMHNANPGNNVLNWFSGGDCIVKLFFTTGEELTRIRRRTGETELLFQRSGSDIISGTLSTTPNMQKLLYKELNFDWDIFTGSSFCSQYNKPWLDMSDQTRKGLLEKITGIDRLTIYAEVAKSRKQRAEAQQLKLKEQVNGINSTIESLQLNIESVTSQIDQHAINQQNKINEKLEQIENFKTQAEAIKNIDIDKLAARWDIIKQIKEKINQYEIKKQYLNSENINNRKAIMESIKKTRKSKDDSLNELEREWKKEDSRSNQTLRTIQQSSISIHSSIATINTKLQALQARIDDWNAKNGTQCIECEQEVIGQHVSHKIEEIDEHASVLNKELSQLNASLTDANKNAASVENDIKKLRATYESDKSTTAKQFDAIIAEFQIKHDSESDQDREIAKLDNMIAVTSKKIEENTPKLTIENAKSQNAQKEHFTTLINNIKAEIENIKAEPNPYITQIDNFNKQIEANKKKIEDCTKQLANYDLIIKHIQYIYKAYSDRTKVKSFLISKRVPFFNSRFSHYLESFHVDVKMQLTDSFSLTSDSWNHAYLSGGERKQYDIAFMLAVLDLHENINGKQSNILVLDEVDGKLDTTGIQDLITIIRTELANKFDSIFVISHRSLMKDMFPNTITVRRTDRLSQVLLNSSAVA